MKQAKKLLIVILLVSLLTPTIATSAKKPQPQYKATLLADENTKPPIDYEDNDKKIIQPTSISIIRVI